jgi:hypothetical protein
MACAFATHAARAARVPHPTIAMCSMSTPRKMSGRRSCVSAVLTVTLHGASSTE